MSISGNRENAGRRLSTSDLAAAGRRPDPLAEDERAASGEIPSPPATGRAQATGRGTAAEGSDANSVQDPLTPPRGQERQAASGGRTTSQRETSAQGKPDSETKPGQTDRINRPPADATRSSETLVALFTPELTETYRAQWLSIQSSFVDDPRKAVRNGDELVAQIMTNLANSFADERHRVEAQLDQTGEGSTENLRVALRRYRSFFERLLSL